MDAHSVLVTILSLALSIGAFAGSVWLNKKVEDPSSIRCSYR